MITHTARLIATLAAAIALQGAAQAQPQLSGTGALLCTLDSRAASLALPLGGAAAEQRPKRVQPRQGPDLSRFAV